MKPDPKTGGRIRDVGALRAARLSGDRCAACARIPSNVHHVVPKGPPHYGDDHRDNLLLLCGTGTSECHGAFHGSPYTDPYGRRWTSEEVRRAIGRTIGSRPNVINYVLDKLGESYGRAWLERVYYLTVEEA